MSAEQSVTAAEQRGIKLIIAYDGRNYSGWQSQSHGRTLQDVIERAVSSINGQPTPILASGRTDRGVHALGQVVTFATTSNLPPAIWVNALNGSLPHDVGVLSAEYVAVDFHPRREAYWKRYRYLWLDAGMPEVMARNYAWRSRRSLDFSAMQAAIDCLRGKHDFAAFESSGSRRKSTVRTILDIQLRRPFADHETLFRLVRHSATGAMLPYPITLRPQALIAMEITADGFLYNMCRTIAGTLLNIGTNLYPPERMTEILAACDRKLAGQTAPACGLYLVEVGYHPFEQATGSVAETGRLN